MNEIGIIDYGAGNMASVEKAIHYAGGIPKRVSTPEAVLSCDRLILPGVGAAGEALAHLRQRHLISALEEVVLKKGRPFLGICLGMQILGNVLHEFGEHQGLGWVPGKVIALKEISNRLPVPHMGWNKVSFRSQAREFENAVEKKNFFYFSHSYTLCVDDPSTIAATVEYDKELVAAIKVNNIFATQFHPEKSQDGGNDLIRFFLKWCP